MENMIDISQQIPDGENDVVIDYYMLQHGKVEDGLHISMCPGDMFKICNALWDYENILSEFKSLFPDSGSGMIAEVYREQLHGIRQKIQSALDYSADDAHEKCVRNSAKKVRDEGIGEEAMVLAIRRASDTAKKKDAEILANKPGKKKTEKKRAEKQTTVEPEESDVLQMDIFDYPELLPDSMKGR